MPTLLSHIVAELAMRYPHAVAQDISSTLITSIENEILPDAVRIMSLPSPPSKMRFLLEKKREERRKKRYRKEPLANKKELIEENNNNNHS